MAELLSAFSWWGTLRPGDVFSSAFMPFIDRLRITKTVEFAWRTALEAGNASIENA
jgi:hypothetical protein